MNRFARLAATLAVAAAALVGLAAFKGTPTFQIDGSGTSRCFYVWDFNNPSASDKGLPFGCVDGKGAWNLPANLRNAKEIDETVLRGYGYVGDGNSHPLSGVTSLNGRSTAGWTLGQWQAVVPSAAALSDEVDWAVLQSVIANAGSSALKIKLGPGTAVLNKALKICAATVSITGAGDQNTALQYTADVNGIEKCINSPDTGRTATPLYLSNLAINKSTSGGTGRGIYGRWIPGAIGGAINDVRITNFNQATELWSAGGWHIDHLWANSGVAAGGTQGNGFSLMGNTVFVVHIQNSQMQGFADAWHFEAANDYAKLATAGMEDIALRSSGAGDAKVCIRVKSTNTGYSPLQWNIDNFACEAKEGFVYAEQAHGIVVNSGSWIIGSPVGTWTGVGKDFFLFARVETGSLRNAVITNNAVAMTISSYVHLGGATIDATYGGDAHNVTIENNKFEYANLTASNNQIWKEFEAVGIRVANNQFTSGFSVQAVPPSNAFKWVGNGTGTDSLVRVVPGEIIALSGSSVAHTSASATNDASASLPPGVWSCSINSILLPAGGASASLIQAGFNTTSAALPTAPANGYFAITGTFTGGITYNYGPWVFDFTTATANTTIYAVGLISFSGGTMAVSSAGQCLRIR